jgi:preprotein translocase subunit SecY
MYRQQGQSHIPLRVNSAGMIPLIFATSIMIFPPIFAQFVSETADVGWIASFAGFDRDVALADEPALLDRHVRAGGDVHVLLHDGDLLPTEPG